MFKKALSNRSIAVLATLIVLALGVSAFALAPVVFGEGGAAGSATSALEGQSGSSGTAAQASSRGSDGGVGGADSGTRAESGTQSTGGGPGGTADTGASGNGSPTDATGTGSGSEQPSAGTSPGGDSASSEMAPTYQFTATLSIDASTMGRGYIMAPRTVGFAEGETVFDVLSRECRSAGIPMEHSFNPLYNSVYVEGIDNLYEFDGGPQSGWMYSVNAWYPNYGCSVYVLSEGDTICWRYTCNLGVDIGGGSAIGG
ncbi:MAG: DUF4430 domain-containing protein [Coriobacteriales bacterium]|jgi:hypothetical protein|nr:DUF4430 domain-containing protein [Coriobacteriales bacterium]